VLTLQKNQNIELISTSTKKLSVDELLSKEWLLTNGRGSYASSTIAGCNTRGYHGLLIGSLNPPVQRVMALSNCLEMIISKEKVFNLSTFEFDDKIAPKGYRYLTEFRKDTGVHFTYNINDVEITKSLFLVRDTDTIALVYDFSKIPDSIDFILRPFVGLKDFHSMQKSYAPLCSVQTENNVLVRHKTPGSCELLLNCPSAIFEKDPQWWFNFVYRNDEERGQNFKEDLWAPGFFKCHIDSPAKIILWANLSLPGTKSSREKQIHGDINKIQKELQKYNNGLLHNIKNKKNINNFSLSKCRSDNENILNTFCMASDQFIVNRRAKQQKRYSIIAGYPWFADWGRDAFISLPGLLLATGRLDEAKSVLTTFAAAADEGMIPSRFDDDSSTACFNSVDASLWFINAAFQYLQVSKDTEAFKKELLPTIELIVESYQKGTKFNIHSDQDGLITAGDEQTQLTWMDAKYDGIAFTPRCGKAVEVNALWYNCLCFLAQFYAEQNNDETSKHYQSKANQVGVNFCNLFWNEKKQYLNDCIFPDGKIDDSIRPNQLYAVSLQFSPLTDKQQKSIVKVVQDHLLTPYGLRTLNPSAENYKGLYIGPQRQRDEAYHQGTVWAFLMGPFIESFLKINQYNQESKNIAAKFIEPLMNHLTEDGCLGSISEIFDGDAPHKSKGCFAQAWSVAELIRAYQLIYS